jgi:hypothetical protein
MTGSRNVIPAKAGIQTKQSIPLKVKDIYLESLSILNNGGYTMRNFILLFSLTLAIFAIISCGEDKEETPLPTTGSVSGTVTFVGTPPEGAKEIQVSIFSTLDAKGRPAGPPDYYSEPFTLFTGKVPYKISGVSFGTYKLAAVGYEVPNSPVGTPETVLGMYGFAPPADMKPDSFTISKENPDVTGIDITADYSAIKR